MEPKFHYGDHIEIKQGFYTGQEGRIVDTHKPWFSQRVYLIKSLFNYDYGKIWLREDMICLKEEN